MLFHLADYLSQYHTGFNVFQYITLRAILGVLTALIISFLVGPLMIQRLAFHQIGQTVRDDGPESHLSKAGTPTMGGSLLLVAVAVSTLFWSDLTSRYVWVVLIVTLLYGVIGFIDDYKKLVLRDPAGLAARYKYFWQSVVGLGAAWFLYATAAIPAETQLIIPFVKSVVIDMGPWFVLLTYFVIVGSSNAVNLTDGLDGLAIMPTVLVAGALAIGALFGLVKGVLIAAILLVALTAFLPKGPPVIKKSLLAPHVALLSEAMVKVVPQQMKQQFDVKLKELQIIWKTK